MDTREEWEALVNSQTRNKMTREDWLKLISDQQNQAGYTPRPPANWNRLMQNYQQPTCAAGRAYGMPSSNNRLKGFLGAFS